MLKELALFFFLDLGLTSNSSDEEVKQAFKKTARKAHPDKGGSTEQSQRLHAARDAWDQAQRQTGRPRPPPEQAPPPDDGPRQRASTGALSPADLGPEPGKTFRVQATAVLLTYFGFTGLPHWKRFVDFVLAKRKDWKVKHWCATLEESKAHNLHVHLMLQFTTVADRSSRSFSCEGLAPRADPTDLLGEGFTGDGGMR